MYTVKIKGYKRIVEGSYIPVGYSCECKALSFKIEVPKCATDEQVRAIVELIRK